MQVVVNHLTRMQKGFVCVAGVDPTTERHVRPVLTSQMRTDMLACHGGPFELGYRVELGETKFVGKIGLSRAFKSSDEHPAVHWLQINNIHLPPTDPRRIPCLTQNS